MSFKAPNDTHLTFLGQSAFHLVTPGGKRLVIDPWIQQNPLCPAKWKDIGHLDALLVTHGHGDHIGDAVELGKSTGAPIVCVPETAHWLGTKGLSNPIGMNKGGTARRDGLAFTMVHADHSCGIFDNGQVIYGGEAVGYIITLENGFKIYHAGDTAVFGDMKLIGEIYKPDLALLPIGDHYVMSPLEAAHACRLLGVAHMVPMHYATFPVLTGTPDALRGHLSDLNVETEVLVLEPGETLA